MPKILHLLKADAAGPAVPVIERAAAAPGAEITVVVLDGGPAPALPPPVRVRRLGEGDLDYAGLLDLIFESDHVIAW